MCIYIYVYIYIYYMCIYIYILCVYILYVYIWEVLNYIEVSIHEGYPQSYQSSSSEKGKKNLNHHFGGTPMAVETPI